MKTFKIFLKMLRKYFFDVLVIGSFSGLIYTIAYFLENYFNGTSYILWQGYVKGIIMYWIIDSILAKFREIYKEVENE